MLQSSRINRHLSTLQGVQFASEYLISMRGPPKERTLYLMLGFFEVVKLHLRWQKLGDHQMFISENNPIEPLEIEEEEAAQKFSEEWVSQEQPKDVDLKVQLENALNSLKKDKPKFNLGYQEVLDRSQLKMGVITTLPIPAAMKKPKKRDIKVFIGEVLYLIRPLVHCALIIIYGTKSYVGYLTSLVIDMLRLLLQKNINFHRKCEKHEMKTRMREMIIAYMLRSPFYQEILKKRILEPILGLLFKKNSLISRLIIQFIELRSSASLQL